MSAFYSNPDYKGTIRYDMGRFLEWTQGMYDALDNRYIRDLRALAVAGTLPVLDQEYRPDLVAYDIYGTVEMWTVPLLYNSFMSEESLRVGVQVRFPALGDVEGLYFRYITLSKAK